MCIHIPSAAQHCLKVIKANSERDGQSNHRPQREASAHPVPQRKDVGLCDAKFLCGRRIGRGGDKVTSDVFVARPSGEQPLFGGASIGEGFLGCEGFRCHDEKRRGRV